MSIVDGLTFIEQAETRARAIWGGDSRIAWASGEPLMLCGPQGVGKTTLLQQLVLARLGPVREVIGLPVDADRDANLLLIAADRPAQIARSLARMVEPADHETLQRRLVVWKGPIEADVRKTPQALTQLAQQHNASTVAVDSLKDIASDLKGDEGGSAVAKALQHLVANGIEVVVNHHQRKAQQGGGRPKHLDDVYGSNFLTACCGSVILLWGSAGDLVVEVDHLKQPADPIGPMQIRHDHDAGRSIVIEKFDALDALRETGRRMSPRVVAARLYGKNDPTRADVERCRRDLERLVEKQLAERSDARPPATVEYWIATHARLTRLDQTELLTPSHEQATNGSTIESRGTHATHAPPHSRSSPSLEEGTA